MKWLIIDISKLFIGIATCYWPAAISAPDSSSHFAGLTDKGVVNSVMRELISDSNFALAALAS
jgi:hypothetical protein